MIPFITSSSLLQVCITVGISCVVLPKTLGISVDLLSLGISMELSCLGISVELPSLGISVDLPKSSESVLWICPKSSEISVELPNILGKATVVN